MNWKKYKLIGLDSNIFSYQFHQHPVFGPFAKEIFDILSLNKSRAVTSIITLTEVLSIKVVLNKLKELENAFSETPNLLVLDVDHEIASEAASIRRKYGFRLPDTIQLATGVSAKANIFITNDAGLKKFKELKVVLLADLF